MPTHSSVRSSKTWCFQIDTLKAEVPIWKHQVFDDRTEEWVGTP